MATTPSLRSTVNTPPTPLHGAKYDTYQPYSTRKSTRSLTQHIHRPAKTPPSQSPSSDPRSHTLAADSDIALPLLSAAHTYSPPSSTQTSPQKRSFISSGNNRRRTVDVLGSTTTALASGLLEPLQNSDKTLSLPHTSTVNSTTMLPTPAKTPRKKWTQQAPGLSSAARVLFSTRPDNLEDAMLTPRRKEKKGRKHIGFSLNESMEEDGVDLEGKIEIFTDSKDKVPELDHGQDNPFYVNQGEEAASKAHHMTRGSKRRKISGDMKGNEGIDEDFKREDGMVYVFRGKKVFRRFPGETDELAESASILSSDSWDDAEVEVSTSPRLRPFTRSSIKPRLLFPTAEQQQARESMADLVDEEAITDIEEHESEIIAPVETEESVLVTPVKAFFTPASPPMTGHLTRSATKKAALDSSPLMPEVAELQTFEGHEKKPSPFDGWQRSKAGLGKGKKREGDFLEKIVGGPKKIKAHEV